MVLFTAELVTILLLTLLNGVLAMSEIAIVSARKIRLQQLVDEGSTSARRALELANDQNRFLATVQIGITMVGVLLGAFAGATIAEELAEFFARLEILRPISDGLALATVVVVTTYFSLVIGELVPKRLGLQNPERVAVLVAPAMHWLSVIASPFVRLLSLSTDLVMRLLGVRASEESPVTEAEIEAMMEQGVQAGIFGETDQEMVSGVFSLGDRRVAALMTPRTEIEWLDLDDPLEENLNKIIASKHSRFPAAHGSLDKVVGIIRAKDLLNTALSQQPIQLPNCTRDALFIPETMMAGDALARFKQSGKHMALVVSEYGGIEGLITFNNLIEEIVGDIEQVEAVQRADGSWLLDGLTLIDEIKDRFGVKELPGEDDHQYETLGGFVMAHLGRIPKAGDLFESSGLRFEVMDMDGKRVDKVLIVQIKPEVLADEGQSDAE
ncbi:MAG: hemolysin family protein [Anaerolineae bacterium]|nr:hemolysin family protein [Anaerolineae bacterium]